MKTIFEVKAVDKKVYNEKIKEFLPDKIIDIHTHIWLREFKKKLMQKVVKWPSRVAQENPVEHLMETYRLMLPGKTVTPVVFNSPSKDFDTDALNRYVSGSAKKYKLPPLMLSRPEWTAAEFTKRLEEGKFLGAKPYLSFAPAYIPASEIRIFDFMPHHQLNVLNKHGKLLMLHIPRDARLKDPVNLEQMLEIEKTYPNIKLVIAHVGRAYCPTDMGDAFEVLSKTEKMYFDISANTNETVFSRLIEAAGPGRIIFGSDLPIARMRMRRICERGVYVNLVPKGLYGDVSGDKNMREVSSGEAKKLTFFLYEEILAFLNAARKTGLSKEDIEKVFYSNAASLIEAAGKPVQPQLHMVFPEKNFKKASVPRLPAGYTLRTFKKGDEKQYVSVMKKAGFEKWSQSQVDNVLKTALHEGVFFIIHNKTGKAVATTCAQIGHMDIHPRSGVIGWVATDPAHRGKKLGYIVCMAAVRRLIKEGYKRIYLTTDDWRLPALKTYLQMGFVPFYFHPGMKKRWSAVMKQLGWKQ